MLRYLQKDPLIKNRIPTTVIPNAFSIFHSLYSLLTTPLLYNAARLFKVSTVIAMACSKLSKIQVTKQHEKTWSVLHKRLMEMEFNFQELFNNNVWEFLQKKKLSLLKYKCRLPGSFHLDLDGICTKYRQFNITKTTRDSIQSVFHLR